MEYKNNGGEYFLKESNSNSYIDGEQSFHNTMTSGQFNTQNSLVDNQRTTMYDEYTLEDLG